MEVNKDELVKKLVRLLRKEHINYEETKYIFKRVRDSLDLKCKLLKKQLPKFLTYDEVQRVIDTGYRTKGLYGLIIKFLFTTGLRVSELVNLKVDELFLDENKIRVEQGKGGKDRMVLVDDSLKKELLVYLNNSKRGLNFFSFNLITICRVILIY